MVSSLWGLELKSFQGVQPGTPPPLWMSGFSWTHPKMTINLATLLGWEKQHTRLKWPMPIRLMRLYRFVVIYLAQVSINHETRQTTIRAWDPKLTPPPNLTMFWNLHQTSHDTSPARQRYHMQFRLLHAAAPEELVRLGQEAALALVALMEAPHVAENHHLERQWDTVGHMTT